MSYNLGRLARAEGKNRALVVAMNQVKFLPFGSVSAIGTRDLGGCSVVVIASKYGAILAHIPPMPDCNHLHDPYYGDRHVQEIMHQVNELYSRRRNYFPAAESYLICAMYNGEIALPYQKKIMEDNLSRMGLKYRPINYVVPRNDANPGHGTVFVDSNGQAGMQMPLIYVEDRLESNVVQTPQESPWFWSAHYRRYYRLVNRQYEWGPFIH